MKKIGTLGLGLIIIISLIQCKTVQVKEVKPQLDAYFEQQEGTLGEGDKPGYSMIITKKDSIIYKRNFGFVDLDNKTPITETTIFDIASASKQFTGMAIALLEEQGKININDKVIKYLPDLSEAMNDITVYQLVHHTSGVRDWPTLLALKGWQPEKPLSLDDIYDILKKQESLNFTPGAEFSYSNSNYNLLAKIVEAVTDTSFERWLHDNIFVALEMESTSFGKNNNLEENTVANSYYFDGNEYVPFANNLNAYGSSSLISSTADMSKWLINFNSKTVGGVSVYDKITQKGNLNNSKTIDYGYGLYLKEIKNKKGYGHDGAWGGYRSATAFFPNENVGVVILSNNGLFRPQQIMNDIVEILFCDEPKKKTKKSETTEQEINDEFFALCAGKYEQVDDKGCYLTFFKEGDEYFLNMYDKNVKLFAKSDSVYFVKEAKAEFVFHLRNGKVNSHTLVGQTGNYLALRVEEDKKEANINYDKLTGTFYSSELDVNYEIRYENDELIIHSAVFPEDIILEHSEELTFKSNSVLIQSILFFKKNGEITSLAINNPRAKYLLFEKAN
ncbi:MAG: beta-lactamase family protein [Bacteroidales bacterium]|nr:beta-lactamase family protein [Bacteroidales bacterium]MCF8352149.1 beta-lactamase family protein [Bacteroidales bacterium]MCF8375167.1 beta-lactamase family protein [Bacteroidales bacterium]MCF8400711.1 beta-lactamase family protein [Bacteroidales bacterium]